jgi:hypothetical protein
MAETLNGSDATMRRAVVHDPEDATGVVIRRSGHHLFDEPVKGGDAILGFTAAKDAGTVDVQGGDISPGAAAGVLVLDVHGSTRPAVLGGMLAAAGLNAGFFIGGDHELIILQRPALPLASVEIQHASGLGREVRVTREDPTAVIPRPKGVFMQPTPQCAATDRGHQAALLDLLNQIPGAPAGQRPTVLGGQFTGQSFNLHDEVWGKKSGGDPDEHVLPAPRGGQQKSASAKGKRPHGGCPNKQRSRRWACLRQHGESFWHAGPENTATYILPHACATPLPRQARV